MSRDDRDDPPSRFPEAQVLLPLARELAEQLAERYRIETDRAYGAIVELWETNHQLHEQAAKTPDPRRLKRTRAYKQAADHAKSTTYYGLRTYKQDLDRLAAGVKSLRELCSDGVDASDLRVLAARDEIVTSHISTSERLPDLDAFFAALFEQVPGPTSILDVGCGVQPLLYPFDEQGSVTARYLGLDRDDSSVRAVNAWGAHVGGERLSARRWSLSDGFTSVVGPEPDGRFGLALGLKLIPVLARQERNLLPIFQDLPARLFLVSGARQSMVKRRSIERRERASLLTFAEALHFEVVGSFEIESELVMLMKKR